LQADGNGDGFVDAADYTYWRDRYVPPATSPGLAVTIESERFEADLAPLVSAVPSPASETPSALSSAGPASDWSLPAESVIAAFVGASAWGLLRLDDEGAGRTSKLLAERRGAVVSESDACDEALLELASEGFLTPLRDVIDREPDGQGQGEAEFAADELLRELDAVTTLLALGR
jgi:hypothetical protein